MKNYAYLLILVVFEMFAMEKESAFALQKYGDQLLQDFKEEYIDFSTVFSFGVTQNDCGSDYISAIKNMCEINEKCAKKAKSDFLGRWEKIKKIRDSIPTDVEHYRKNQERAAIVWFSSALITEFDIVRQLYSYKKEECSTMLLYGEALFSLVALGKGIVCAYNSVCAERRVGRWQSCFRINIARFEDAGKELFPQDFGDQKKTHDD